MAILKKCWVPFMVYSWTSVKIGCFYAALYTGIFHLLFICYSLYVIDGGKSDEFYSPFFELNQSGATVAGSIAIVFSILFLLACSMLIYGVKNENRCMFFPWMIGATFEILLMVCIGIWFLFRYYYNVYSFLASFILWCIDGLHLYCLLCVITQYQILQKLQEPRFVILYP
ncbi:uncharacterized protein [Parasteatoda tepidariorum]|uniref:Uncharacterized protein n=1 Tax=Parasteatoda tepidariorum TaxID=114398 RepID=A0A2L2YJA2_PARTP|nr:uncharacterized protein LOC107441186 [Parasteatoda tepidariorum]